MNGQAFGAVVVATWRERLSRPIALIVCVLICAGVTGSAITADHTLQDPTLVLSLILASGSVGRDVSSGVLALVLTRPLVRTTYLLAKWTAVSTAVAALGCATLGPRRQSCCARTASTSRAASSGAPPSPAPPPRRA